MRETCIKFADPAHLFVQGDQFLFPKLLMVFQITEIVLESMNSDSFFESPKTLLKNINFI